MSSSLAMEPSTFRVPVRIIPAPGGRGILVDGHELCISLWTTIRPVPTSHNRSHDPADSKMGLVTPAMKPGLGRLVRAEGGLRTCHSHSFPFIAIREVSVGEGTGDKTAHDGATSRSKGACREDVA